MSDLLDDLSWLAGLILLPVALLWRVYKLIKQLLTDT